MNYRYEINKYWQGYTHVIGCDEVGKGSLAGPVVAAAVVLPLQAADDKLKVESYKVIKSCGIKDSKLLLPKKREELAEVIKQNCVAWGIGLVESKIIDEINIHQATLLAMRRAVESLLASLQPVIPRERSRVEPACRPASLAKRVGMTHEKCLLVIDGKFCIPKFDMKQEAVVEGDNKILSVAAASIIAKVYRDNLMKELHEQYPCYDFFQHKGYGTLHHRQMIIKHGLSEIHRVSFCGRLMTKAT